MFFILAVMAIFLMNAISAEIVIVQNPSILYNLGDMVSVPVKITSLSDSAEVFFIQLLCDGTETELHRENIILSAGQEVEKNPPILLIKRFIGDLRGNCKLKYVFGSEAKLTGEFVISDLINVDIKVKN